MASRSKRRTLFGRSEDGAADRLARKGGGVEQVDHEIVGRVLQGRDFLQDHVLLALQLGRVEQAGGEDVGEHVEREAAILAQHAGVIGGAFDAGRGVEVAARAFDGFGDGAGVAPPRALEGHVFEQMRQALLGFAFAARSRGDERPERGGLQSGHRIGDDAQAGGQFAGFNRHF